MTDIKPLMREPTTRDIIDALGGVNHVAHKICVERLIVDNWLRPGRGIAATYWLDILTLARRQKVTWINHKVLKVARGTYSTKA